MKFRRQQQKVSLFSHKILKKFFKAIQMEKSNLKTCQILVCLTKSIRKPYKSLQNPKI